MRLHGVVLRCYSQTFVAEIIGRDGQFNQRLMQYKDVSVDDLDRVQTGAHFTWVAHKRFGELQTIGLRFDR